MEVVHYWSNYVSMCKEYIKRDKYIVNFNVKDLSDYETGKYFFFENRLEVIKFIKYVILPTSIYNKVGVYKSENKIIVQDYKDVLNFFVSNDIKDSKEMIKRYSFFYNSLEEFEYEKNAIADESFRDIVEKINLYFSLAGSLKSSIYIYEGIEDLLDGIICTENEYFSKKIIEILGASTIEELKEFLLNNKNNEVIVNFILDTIKEIYNEVDLSSKE